MSSVKQQVGAWHVLDVAPAILRLPATLLSGMSFRWQPVTQELPVTHQPPGCSTQSYVGVLDRWVFELIELRDCCKWRMLLSDEQNEAAAEALLLQHLRLGAGPSAALLHEWSASSQVPPEFLRATQGLKGVRVLNVELLECLVTFLGSANNSIKRNMKMIESLCSAFPQNLLVHDHTGTPYYTFPTLNQLLSLSEEQLWSLGWGYRAPRLYKLVREVDSRGGLAFLETIEELPDAAARQCLCQLTGVGRKVADCVLLFGYGRDSVVPVDTHCFQLAQRSMLPAAVGRSLCAGLYRMIVSRFHQVFGEPFAGWAFMMMFVAELPQFRKVLEQQEAAVWQARLPLMKCGWRAKRTGIAASTGSVKRAQTSSLETGSVAVGAQIMQQSLQVTQELQTPHCKSLQMNAARENEQISAAAKGAAQKGVRDVRAATPTTSTMTPGPPTPFHIACKKKGRTGPQTQVEVSSKAQNGCTLVEYMTDAGGWRAKYNGSPVMLLGRFKQSVFERLRVGTKHCQWWETCLTVRSVDGALEPNYATLEWDVLTKHAQMELVEELQWEATGNPEMACLQLDTSCVSTTNGSQCEGAATMRRTRRRLA